ncbi:protein of unknown function [Lachnospira multipara]|uniref:Spore protein YkvP/CgeB glycosyl transferase-like domain-containing protein n=2 Tax=Lachnospira multipara TaxID=28051 RepID=A0A1H5SWY6_9FIRM|nr:protein of unknown function [Lachnospira multipara]
MQPEVEETFKELNYDYEAFYLVPKDWNEDERLFEITREKLLKGNFSHVFSINYSSIIAEAIKSLNKDILYINWNHSVPFETRNLEGLNYDFNRSFIFDRAYTNRLLEAGYKNVYHLPLATKIRDIAFKNPAYTYDVSFVGSMYVSEYKDFSRPLSQNLRGYLDGLVEFQCQLNGGNIFNDCINNELLEKINGEIIAGAGRPLSETDVVEDLKSASGFAGYSKEQIYYLLSREATKRQRLLALMLLESRFKTALFSKDEMQELKNTYMGGYIDYSTKMPEIFRNSKINLNVSLSCIETGIPLRVLDIIACGGLVLSNFQPEIYEYFRPDEDIICFNNSEELLAKASFLIKEDSFREKVIENGLEIIKKAFSYKDRVEAMFGMK